MYSSKLSAICMLVTVVLVLSVLRPVTAVPAFQGNSDNEATYSDITIIMEAFYEGRPFRQPKVAVFVNTELCWRRDRRGDWLRRRECVLRDVPGTAEIERCANYNSNETLCSEFFDV